MVGDADDDDDEDEYGGCRDDADDDGQGEVGLGALVAEVADRDAQVTTDEHLRRGKIGLGWGGNIYIYILRVKITQSNMEDSRSP